MTDDQKWEYWKQLARELGESTTLRHDRVAVAKQIGRYLDLADPPVVSIEAPRFEHDCAECKFLGKYIDSDDHAFDADLYFCSKHYSLPKEPSLVARFGSRQAHASLAKQEHPYPFMKEAKKRAIARGLMSE